jgi:mono/diheme cytochrome c family protein
MKPSGPGFLLVLCSTLAVVARVTASGQPTTSLAGDGTYRLYCASCHGTKAGGDGPLASSLKRPPPNLTLLARSNGGTFPSDLVAKIIDGRSPVTGHGGGDMPVWGDAFSRSDERTPVPERIARVVKYLESIQVKP